MSLLTTVIIVILVVVIFVAVIYFLCNGRKKARPKLEVEEGTFVWLEPNNWSIPPIDPLSEDSILGSLSFADERYDPKQDSLSILYKGRLISQNQAWVLRGKANKNLDYWGFGLFKLHDERALTLQPVGYGLNKEMLRDTRHNDDVVIIISPNYKLAEFVANQIHQRDYNKSMPDERHVVFTYVPIPNYDASAKYSYLFEATRNQLGITPTFKVLRYTYFPDSDNLFPFYPVERSNKPKTITKHTVDETKSLGEDSGIFDKQMEAAIEGYHYKTVATPLPQHNLDSLYTSTETFRVQAGETIIVGAVDHSSNGKCLYSELIFVDVDSGKVYASQRIGNLDPISVDPKGKIKIFSSIVPVGLSSVRIYEKLVLDISTRIGPAPQTVVPARVYVLPA